MQKKLNNILFQVVMLDFGFGHFATPRNTHKYFTGRVIGKLESTGLFDFNVNGISFDSKAVEKIEMVGNVPKIQIKSKL